MYHNRKCKPSQGLNSTPKILPKCRHMGDFSDLLDKTFSGNAFSLL